MGVIYIHLRPFSLLIRRVNGLVLFHSVTCWQRHYSWWMERQRGLYLALIFCLCLTFSRHPHLPISIRIGFFIPHWIRRRLQFPINRRVFQIISHHSSVKCYISKGTRLPKIVLLVVDLAVSVKYEATFITSPHLPRWLVKYVSVASVFSCLFLRIGGEGSQGLWSSAWSPT